MDPVVYRSQISLVRHQGPLRTAQMPAGESVDFGVHSAIAEHYGVSMAGKTAVSTTLDYVVAAAAG